MAWAATHLEGVKNHCVHQVTINQPLPQEVLSDPSFTLDLNDTHPANATGSVNGTIAPLSITTTVNHPGMLTNQAFSSDFLDKLEAISCSNECSGNGICVNGEF